MTLYRLIDEESRRQPVSRLCRTLGVTRSGFYEWQRQPLSDRALADWLLTEQIRAIFDESEQTYGSPRVFKELKLGRGLQIGEKRVARLMRQAGLVSIYAKKRTGSTTRAAEHPTRAAASWDEAELAYVLAVGPETGVFGPETSFAVPERKGRPRTVARPDRRQESVRASRRSRW